MSGIGLRTFANCGFGASGLYATLHHRGRQYMLVPTKIFQAVMSLYILVQISYITENKIQLCNSSLKAHFTTPITKLINESFASDRWQKDAGNTGDRCTLWL